MRIYRLYVTAYRAGDENMYETALSLFMQKKIKNWCQIWDQKFRYDHLMQTAKATISRYKETDALKSSQNHMSVNVFLQRLKMVRNWMDKDHLSLPLHLNIRIKMYLSVVFGAESFTPEQGIDESEQRLITFCSNNHEWSVSERNIRRIRLFILINTGTLVYLDKIRKNTCIRSEILLIA